VAWCSSCATGNELAIGAVVRVEIVRGTLADAVDYHFTALYRLQPGLQSAVRFIPGSIRPAPPSHVESGQVQFEATVEYTIFPESPCELFLRVFDAPSNGRQISGSSAVVVPAYGPAAGLRHSVPGPREAGGGGMVRRRVSRVDGGIRA